MDFIEAAHAMCAGANDLRVGLVLRFNADERKVKTLWSEPSGEHDGTNPPACHRPLMFRLCNDDNISQGIRGAWPINDVAGYHAEEILIATWPRLLAEYNLTEDELTRVDIVLSKSPCIESSPLIVRIGTMKVPRDERYSKGCAMKLRQFCEIRRTVKFNIYYVALAGAHTGDYQIAARKLIQGLRRWMTDEEALHLEPARQALPTSFVSTNLSEKALEEIREMVETLRSAYLLLIRSTKDNKKKAEYAKAMTDISKSTKQFEDKLKTVREALRQLEIGARKESLNNAQKGIVQLDSLANVSIERWIPT